MYIWNTRKLVADLSKGQLPQHEQFKYLLVWVLISLLLYELPSSASEPYSLERAVISFGSAVITLVGTVHAYRANKGRAGSEFLVRYVSLSLPIFVRLFVLMVPVMFLYFGIAEHGFGIDVTSSTTWGDAGFLLGFETLFFYRLAKNIRQLAEQG